MTGVSRQRKYCATCQRIVANMRMRKCYAKAKKMPKRAKKYYGDASQCRTCRFWGVLAKGQMFCDYIEICGKMRGCDPSPNCNKYERRA